MAVEDAPAPEAPPQPVTSARPRTSEWAAASLLCSAIVCCPAMTIIGPILGLRALVQIKANPALRGRKLALAGIAVGSLVTLGYALGMVWWHFSARIPMMHGPREELRAGLLGDYATFKHGFTGDGATADDKQAAVFLRMVADRYGRFVDSEQSTLSPNLSSMAGPAEFRVSYTLQFDRGPVQAEAVFVTFAPSKVIPKPVFKWRWLRIADPQRGEMVYPDSAVVPALATQPAPAPPGGGG